MIKLFDQLHQRPVLTPEQVANRTKEGNLFIGSGHGHQVLGMDLFLAIPDRYKFQMDGSLDDVLIVDPQIVPDVIKDFSKHKYFPLLIDRRRLNTSADNFLEASSQELGNKEVDLQLRVPYLRRQMEKGISQDRVSQLARDIAITNDFVFGQRRAIRILLKEFEKAKIPVSSQKLDQIQLALARELVSFEKPSNANSPMH